MTPPGRDRAIAVAAVVVAAGPVLGAAASVVGRHWYASGDQGIELLRIADVGTRHTPLVGAWSRLGWAHPGPLLFWLLAPFSRAFGATGVLVAVALLNAGAAAGAVLLARRRGLVPAALVATGFAVLAHAMAPALLVDPWNPWVPVLPFALFLVAAWCVACGDGALLAVAVGVGSLCVQSHASYAPLVAGVLVTALVAGRRQLDRRAVAVAAGVGVVLWLPPVVQQLTGHPGNLTAVLDGARHPVEQVAGWADALGVLGAQLRAPGPWLTGNDPDVRGVVVGGRVAPGIVVLALLVLAAWWSARRGRTIASRLCSVAVAASLLAVVTTARTSGVLVPYLLRWWWPVATVAMLALALACVPDLARRAVAIVTVGVGAAVAIATVVALPAQVPFAHVSDGIAAVAGPTAARLDPSRRYLVRGVDAATLHASRVGLFVELERRGFHVFLDPLHNAGLTYGRWRLATAGRVDAVLTITADADVVAGWTPPAGSRLLARWRSADGGYVVYLSDPFA